MKGLPRALRTGLRLRCPACRQGPLFTGRFRMHPACPRCGYVIEREPGYFVGAIYINYAATVALCLGGYLLLEWLAAPGLAVQLALWLPAGAALPILFFRHARSLWLSVDHLISRKAQDGGGQARSAP
ncbi:MAG: DUF983 domain-containing protein [Nitrospinota bacterium]